MNAHRFSFLPATLLITAVILSVAYAAVAQSVPHPQARQSQQVPPSDANSDWYSQVQRQLAEEEYQIRWQPKHGAYSSPNRAQNLRTRYYHDGFSVEPRVDSLERWSLRLRIAEISKGGSDVLSPRKSVEKEGAAGVCVSGGQMTQDHDGFQVQYQNDGEGMRQNIVVDRRPAGSGLLRVRLEISGSLAVKSASGNRAEFADRSGVVQATYGGLSVWDAKGQVLSSRLVKSGNELLIEVEDDRAEYPVMIDPLVMGGLSDTANWVAEGNQAEARFGWSVSSAGDVNGDGYSDVIVGADSYDNAKNGVGRAYVYYGSSKGLSDTARWIAEGSGGFGFSVSSAGDVNSDGYSDVIIGAPYYTNGQLGEGGIFVYYGSNLGLLSTPAWSDEGNQNHANFGYSVSSAGDVNSDGYSDVIIGMPGYSNEDLSEGRAVVYYGSSNGLSATSSWIVESNMTFGMLGMSVSSAGDVNDDGYSDIIIGVPGYSNGELYEGAAVVYYGAKSGLSTTSAWTVKSNQEGGNLGECVSSAGDVNGDGYSDVIVGAYRYDNETQTDVGIAFVYHGSSSGLFVVPAWTVEGNQDYGWFSYSISSAGDINSDGYSDIIVSSYSYDNRSIDEGGAFIYYGSKSGLLITHTLALYGNKANTYFGNSVSSTGDVNGDGYNDIIIGAFGYDNGETDEGRAFVYHGSPTQGLSAEPPVSLSTVARIEVTPNPVSTSLTQVQLHLPPAMKGGRSLKVYDLLGREVMDVSTLINHTHEQTLSLDCTQLPKGCYLLTLSVAGMPSGVSKMIVVE